MRYVVYFPALPFSASVSTSVMVLAQSQAVGHLLAHRAFPPARIKPQTLSLAQPHPLMMSSSLSLLRRAGTAAQEIPGHFPHTEDYQHSVPLLRVSLGCFSLNPEQAQLRITSSTTALFDTPPPQFFSLCSCSHWMVIVRVSLQKRGFSEILKGTDGYHGSVCRGNLCWTNLASPSLAPAPIAYQTPITKRGGEMAGIEGPSLLDTALPCQVGLMACPPLHFTPCPPGPPYLLTARPLPLHLCPGCAPDREEATRDHTSLTASSESCPEAQSTAGGHTQKAGGTAEGNDRGTSLNKADVGLHQGGLRAPQEREGTSQGSSMCGRGHVSA